MNARRCQSFVARIRETETEGSKPFANVGCIDGGPPIEAKRVLKKSCTTRHPVSHMGVPHSRLCKYGSGTSGSAQHAQRSGGGTWAHDTWRCAYSARRWKQGSFLAAKRADGNVS